MIDRMNLPDFLQDMPEERLKEIMKADDRASNFGRALNKVLRAIKKKGRKKGKN